MKRSVHFGINKYDPKVYGTGATLSGCVNDARLMQQLTTGKGFHSKLFLDSECTRSRFIAEMKEASRLSQPGDTFMFSQSSHGNYEDRPWGEATRRYTALCMYDNIIWDNEVRGLVKLFKAGVRVIWITDCCFAEDNYKYSKPLPKGIKEKFFPLKNIDFEKRKIKVTQMKTIKCQIVALSSSTEYEVSYDMGKYGLFTESLGRAINKVPNAGFVGVFKETQKVMYERGFPQHPVMSSVNMKTAELSQLDFLQ